MKKSSFVVYALLALGLAALLGGCGKTDEPAVKAPLVKTMRIGAADGRESRSYAGEVRGRYESQLAFQVGGKIISRDVELGSRVRAGDVLMELDAKDIVENANIGAAQVESARAKLELAKADLNRFEKLYEAAAVSAAQYEQYKANYEAALAVYKQAQAQYAQGSNAVGYARLLADSDGVIAAVNAESGQVVAAGQAVVTLVKAGELEIEINIPENRRKEMARGRQVEVKLWALPDVKLKGLVREVSPIADPVARTYKTRVTLLNPPEQIQLGMTAEVCVEQGGAAGGAAIPLAAVYQTGDKPMVWVVEDGAAQLREVRIESFGDNQVKVAEGLQAGDLVVTAGVHKLREGQQVRVEAGEQP